MIKPLPKQEWEKLYRQHLVKDFPDNELYTLKQFLKYSNQRKAYLYIEDGISKAYMVTSQNDKIILIQYFAVYKKYRNQGIGTKFLQEYKEIIGSQKVILLEIENPQKAKDKKEYEKRIKRKHFYEKIGFVVDNRVKEYYFYEYYLLLTTNKLVPIQEIKEEINKLYKVSSPSYMMKKFQMQI